MRIALIAALLLGACSPKEYHCVGDQECVASNGTFGLCITTHCAFADEMCTGGFRFDDTAGDQAKLCVSAQDVGAHRDAGVVGHLDGPIATPDAPVTGPDAPLTGPDAAPADAPAGG